MSHDPGRRPDGSGEPAAGGPPAPDAPGPDSPEAAGLSSTGAGHTPAIQVAAPAVTGAPRAGPRAWVGSLQSLRGLAAVWVVLYHLDLTLYNHGQDLIPIPGPRIGWLGVDLFFVLSAYLLGQPFLDGRARPYVRFLGDRFLRIAPAYYAAAAVALATVVAYFPEHLHALRILGSLAFLTNWNVDLYFALNPAFWSLAVEMQFYLLLPAMALLFKGRRWPIGLALTIGATLWARTVTFTPDDVDTLFVGTFGLPGFLSHFGLGLAACRLRTVARPGLAALVGLPLAIVPVLVWIPLDSVVFGFESFKGQVLVRPVCAVGFALLILAAASPGPLRTVLEWAPLRWLGDISYSLYLIHIPLQLVADVEAGTAHNPWAFVGWGLGASLAGGALLYYAVERPAERWRHKRKLRQRTQPLPASAPA